MTDKLCSHSRVPHSLPQLLRGVGAALGCVLVSACPHRAAQVVARTTRCTNRSRPRSSPSTDTDNTTASGAARRSVSTAWLRACGVLPETMLSSPHLGVLPVFTVPPARGRQRVCGRPFVPAASLRHFCPCGGPGRRPGPSLLLLALVRLAVSHRPPACGELRRSSTCSSGRIGAGLPGSMSPGDG